MYVIRDKLKYRAKVRTKSQLGNTGFADGLRQIIRGLHLDTIAHEYYAWRSRESNPAVQIDLVIDRADGIVTICEMKYSKDEYLLTENEYRKIVRRMETFSRETQHKGGVQATIVTTYSLHNNIYSEISPVVITMEHLYK